MLTITMTLAISQPFVPSSEHLQAAVDDVDMAGAVGQRFQHGSLGLGYADGYIYPHIVHGLTR
jgi:hypothetical protein